MTILITGATGFLGWNAVRYFTERGHGTITTFRRLPHYLHFDGARHVELDLADELAIDDVVARFQPNLVLHIAALARPQQDTDPRQLESINVEATRHLASAASRHGVGIVYISSDLVYPSDAGLCNEDSPVAPSGAGGYARSKLLGEEAIRQHADRWMILRSSLLFGIAPPGKNSFTGFIESCWERGEPAPLFTDQFRSFIYAGDLCRAIDVAAVEREEWNRLFVCGGQERLSRGEFGLRYAAFHGRGEDACRLMRARDLEGYVGGASDISLDTSRLRDLGWEPRPLESCFEEMERIRTGVVWSEF